MNQKEFLQILSIAEKLKCQTRHCDTSTGRRESVAEHSWRLALMAMLLGPELPEVDMSRVIRMCLIHDLGEAFTGDIPTFDKTGADDISEENVFDRWVSGFPKAQREEWQGLLSEMNARKTLEARVYKALDKMEAVIQHNESDISTWLPLEYDLQLTYGAEEVKCHPWIRELKAVVDDWTREKIRIEAPKASAEEVPEVICLGSAVVDITAKPVENGNFAEKQRIESISLGIGGDAVNQSLRLSEEGISVNVCARLGRDRNGELLKDALREKGVGLSLLSQREEPSTGTALVLLSEMGERHTFSVRGAHSVLNKKDAEPARELLRRGGVKALSLASLFSMPELEDNGLSELLEDAKKAQTLVFADLASDKRGQGLGGIRRFLPYIDYFMPSDYDACKMTGTDTPEEAAKTFAAEGAGVVIIKCGPKGCYLYEKGEGTWIPALSVTPVNTTGAGDAMTAFFITRILKGDNAREACSYACREASRLVGGLR